MHALPAFSVRPCYRWSLCIALINLLRAPPVGVLAALLQRVHACGGPPSHPYDIVAQKQRILGHTVYLADLECEDAGENGGVPAYKQQAKANGSADELPVMDTEAEKWPRKMWAF
jgi:hypothetical protein